MSIFFSHCDTTGVKEGHAGHERRSLEFDCIFLLYKTPLNGFAHNSPSIAWTRTTDKLKVGYVRASF